MSEGSSAEVIKTGIVGGPENPVILDKDPRLTVNRLAEAATLLHSRLIKDFGGVDAPERQPGMVAAVIAPAFQKFGGHEPYPNDFDKAAMVLRGIAGGHPFTDGNKRTAFATSALLLQELGHAIPTDLNEDAIFELCMRVSNGELVDPKEIAAEYKRICTSQVTGVAATGD